MSAISRQRLKSTFHNPVFKARSFSVGLYFILLPSMMQQSFFRLIDIELNPLKQ